MNDADRVLTWSDLLSPEYRRFTLMLVFSIALHASNFFIFATLAPSVVNDIGGLDLLSWATSLFVVSVIVSSAAGGMLKARFGARRSLVLAAIVFALGSLLTALAPTMENVLVGRTVQGLGAGLLTAYSHGMIRDLFPPASWARLFAVVSGGWGVAALTGPLIGGIFAEYDAWRWGFVMMVVAAGVFVLLTLKSIPADNNSEDTGSPSQIIRLAILGAAALVLGGIGKLSSPGADFVLAGISVICLATTVMLERRSRDPLFPRDMLRPQTVLGGGVMYVFGITFATVVTAVYGPLLFRVIHDIPILTTGYIVTAQSMMWTLAAIAFSGIGRTGSRLATIAGPTITGAGVLITGSFLPSGPVWAAIVGIAIIGFGIGLAWGHIGRFVFEAAGDADRHRVASVIPTFQSVGIAFGSSTAGLIANAAGFAEDHNSDSARTVAAWLYIGLSPAALVALIGGLRVAAGTRTSPNHRSTSD